MREDHFQEGKYLLGNTIYNLCYSSNSFIILIIFCWHIHYFRGWELKIGSSLEWIHVLRFCDKNALFTIIYVFLSKTSLKCPLVRFGEVPMFHSLTILHWSWIYTYHSLSVIQLRCFMYKVEFKHNFLCSTVPQITLSSRQCQINFCLY